MNLVEIQTLLPGFQTCFSSAHLSHVSEKKIIIQMNVDQKMSSFFHHKKQEVLGENVPDNHQIETNLIRGKKITLFWFDHKLTDHLLVTLVHNAPVLKKDDWYNRWFLVDTNKREYKVWKSSLNRKDNPVTIKKETVKNLFKTKKIFHRFLIQNNLPLNTQLNESFLDQYLSKCTFITKKVNIPTIKWDLRPLLKKTNYAYTALLIRDKAVVNGQPKTNVVVGKVSCELVDEKNRINYFESTNPMVHEKGLNAYIAQVDIRQDFQGQGLCRPLVGYMVKQLKRLKKKKLWIENVSSTGGGVPACRCYFHAGEDNQYRMKYQAKDGSLKEMNLKDCVHQTRNTYYYVLD